MDSPFTDLVVATTRAIEILGILAIVVGIAVVAVDNLRPDGRPRSFSRTRATLGRAILLGLELLLAADIIYTVRVEASPESLGILGGIVLIRTLLSLSIDVEIEGRWPWQRGTEPDIEPE